MSIQKSRWSKVYESSEEELIDLLDAMNVSAERRNLEAGQPLELQNYHTKTRLWCAEGSIIIRDETSQVSLQPGDTLLVPANQSYEGDAGIAGCVFYSAPLTTD